MPTTDAEVIAAVKAAEDAVLKAYNMVLANAVHKVGAANIASVQLTLGLDVPDQDGPPQPATAAKLEMVIGVMDAGFGIKHGHA